SVKALLRENEAEVHQLARALAEKGELGADDVRRILNGKLPPRSLDALPTPPKPRPEHELEVVGVRDQRTDEGRTVDSGGALPEAGT
ncbi:MAG TPA: hypothetical protein VGW38_23985, partial [Chloroflexota bacterium]|nr:hypothetical protein [Chloroflexota bacterium]